MTDTMTAAAEERIRLYCEAVLRDHPETDRKVLQRDVEERFETSFDGRAFYRRYYFAAASRLGLIRRPESRPRLHVVEDEPGTAQGEEEPPAREAKAQRTDTGLLYESRRGRFVAVRRSDGEWDVELTVRVSTHALAMLRGHAFGLVYPEIAAEIGRS